MRPNSSKESIPWALILAALALVLVFHLIAGGISQ